MLTAVLIAAAAAAFALWLYTDSKVKSSAGKLQRGILAVLRFTSVAAMLTVIADVPVNKKQRHTQRPTIIVAHDNSASLLMTADSALMRAGYADNIRQLIRQLESRFDVGTIGFDANAFDSISFRFDGQTTNMSAAIDFAKANSYGKNVGAMIIASDGIVNQGADPIRAASALDVPIYTIALGDTLPHPDLLIHKLTANKTAFKESTFPIAVSLKGTDIPHRRYRLLISSNGKTIDERLIEMGGKSVYRNEVFYLTESKIGQHRYDVSIDVPDNDSNRRNNRRSIVVEVTDDVKQILLLQNSWHPDASAFSQVLAHNKHYNLTVSNIDKFNEPLDKYSLIILLQLPSAKHNAENIINQSKKLDIPLLVVVGRQTDVRELPKMGIGIKQKRGEYEEAFPAPNSGFAWFNSNITQTKMRHFPPIDVPYGDHTELPSNQILIYQKIGDIETKRPLIYFMQTQQQKIGVIAGEGIWRWRQADYQHNGSHDVTNDIIEKTIKYLCTHDKRERLVVDIDDVIPSYMEVVANASLYNKTYEPVKNGIISFNITDSTQNITEYVMTPCESGYTLNMGHLKAGNYHYTATALPDDEELVRSGSFSIIEEPAESLNLQANHALLSQLAKEHEGSMFYPNQLEQLCDTIFNNKQIKSVSTITIATSHPIDFMWMALLIIAAMAAEWLLRRIWGLS